MPCFYGLVRRTVAPCEPWGSLGWRCWWWHSDVGRSQGQVFNKDTSVGARLKHGGNQKGYLGTREVVARIIHGTISSSPLRTGKVVVNEASHSRGCDLSVGVERDVPCITFIDEIDHG